MLPILPMVMVFGAGSVATVFGLNELTSSTMRKKVLTGIRSEARKSDSIVSKVLYRFLFFSFLWCLIWDFIIFSTGKIDLLNSIYVSSIIKFIYMILAFFILSFLLFILWYLKFFLKKNIYDIIIDFLVSEAESYVLKSVRKEKRILGILKRKFVDFFGENDRDLSRLAGRETREILEKYLNKKKQNKISLIMAIGVSFVSFNAFFISGFL